MKTAEAYLKRIGIGEKIRPDTGSLARIQKAHFSTVPYENAAIVLEKKVPSLNEDDLFEKIVLRHRGGYCFELNGALAWLLREIGFPVRECFARWHYGEAAPVPFRRHRILLVTSDAHTYIADAGVGCLCPLTPLRLDTAEEQERNGMVFRVLPSETLGYMVSVRESDGWKPFFSFDSFANFPHDYTYANYYCATSPDSVFHNRLMVNLFSPAGRISIGEEPETGLRTFKTFRPDGTFTERKIGKEDDALLRKTLKESFGIVIEDEPAV